MEVRPMSEKTSGLTGTKAPKKRKFSLINWLDRYDRLILPAPAVIVVAAI